VGFRWVLQARFGLCSCIDWGTEDGNFILQRFYKIILELFEDEDDDWVITTLKWWNEYVAESQLLFLV
jgi:hypothetical protein